jgi:hypothetical protein
MRGLDRHINFHKKEFLDLILSYEPTQEQLDNEKTFHDMIEYLSV